MILLQIFFELIRTISLLGKPKVGGAERVNPQEAIPPFSVMESSIQGLRAATLVKTAWSCSSQLSPSLVLTIPIRTWELSFTTVRGPPLSP